MSGECFRTNGPFCGGCQKFEFLYVFFSMTMCDDLMETFEVDFRTGLFSVAH